MAVPTNACGRANGACGAAPDAWNGGPAVMATCTASNCTSSGILNTTAPRISCIGLTDHFIEPQHPPPRDDFAHERGAELRPALDLLPVLRRGVRAPGAGGEVAGGRSGAGGEVAGGRR